MTRNQGFRVHVEGASGDHDHAARFHTAARHLADHGVHTGITNGRPWAALTIPAAGPLDAAFTVGRHMERAAGELTELLAWPDTHEAWPTPAATRTPAAASGDQVTTTGITPAGGEHRDG